MYRYYVILLYQVLYSAGRAVTFCINNPKNFTPGQAPVLNISTSGSGIIVIKDALTAVWILLSQGHRLRYQSQQPRNGHQKTSAHCSQYSVTTLGSTWFKKTCRDTSPCLSSFFQLPTQSSLLESRICKPYSYTGIISS